MRIAIGGLLHKTNTSSALSTTYDDFTIVRGAALIHDPVRQSALAEGHRLFPPFVAYATPSGRVTRACFEYFLGESTDGIRPCLPLDGTLLESLRHPIYPLDPDVE